jgi:hypothetical protein
MKTALLLFKTFLLFACTFLFVACNSTLQKEGPYQGDKVLYDADQTISTAYTAIDVFVSWEKENASALSSQPQIHATAERIRKNAKEWFRSAIVLRDAYAKEPTPEKRAALTNAIEIIRAALTEAAGYMQSNPAKTVTELFPATLPNLT